MVRTIKQNQREYFVASDVCKQLGLPWNSSTRKSLNAKYKLVFQDVITRRADGKQVRVRNKTLTKRDFKSFCKSRGLSPDMISGKAKPPIDITQLPERERKKIPALKHLKTVQPGLKCLLTTSIKSASIKNVVAKPTSARKEISKKCVAYAKALQALNNSTGTDAGTFYDIAYNLLYSWHKVLNPDAPDLKKLSKKSKDSSSILDYAESNGLINSLLVTARILFN